MQDTRSGPDGGEREGSGFGCSNLELEFCGGEGCGKRERNMELVHLML